MPELVAERRALGLHQPYGTTREMLFREAVCSLEPARDLARLLLCAIVQAGYDPTDPEIIGPEMEPAYFATVTMRLIGWPHDFVRPEYREQLERVLRQHATARASRPRDDDAWNHGAGTALAALLNRGVMPTSGKDVAEGLELISKLERAEGEEFEELIEQLCALAAAKQLC